MADTRVLPTANYPAGTRSIPETAIADSVTFIQLAVDWNTAADRSIWPDATDEIVFNIEVRIGGVWSPWNSPARGVGGVHLNKLGAEMPALLVGGDLPAGVGRALRGSITVTPQAPRTAIRTGATLTVL